MYAQQLLPNLFLSPGYNAGILTGSYYIGSLLGNPIWGWLSDLLGRRPVLLLGICGTILSELLFGLSLNFIWAISVVFLWAVLNGYLSGATKAYVTEVNPKLSSCKINKMTAISSPLL